MMDICTALYLQCAAVLDICGIVMDTSPGNGRCSTGNIDSGSAVVPDLTAAYGTGAVV